MSIEQLKNEDVAMIIEKYYIKTRGIRLSKEEADKFGIKRVYNQTSHIDFMNSDSVESWSSSLFNKNNGEACMVESALRSVKGFDIYVSSCIVFHTMEMCNIFFMKHQERYKAVDGFMHLFN